MATAIRSQVKSLVGHKVDALELALVTELGEKPQVLVQAAKNVLESGGKRLRPYLHLLSAELCGYTGDDDVLFGTIIEYVHVASLLHDDVIDEAVLRRGSATLNQRFGDTLTVLVGDFLCMQAQALAVRHGDLDLLEILSRTTLDLVGGEALQEHSRGRLDLTTEEYLEIIELKTGRLMAASCEAAAALGGLGRDDERRTTLAQYGAQLGVAFQLTDDVLDFESDEKTLGKPVMSDLREGTLTLPAIHALAHGGPEAERVISLVMKEGKFESVSEAEVLAAVKDSGGLAAARELAKQASDKALTSLECFPDGLSRRALAFAAEFTVSRQY